MNSAAHFRSSGIQQYYCGSACGRDLADLFLHVGSGRLLTQSTDASEAIMNDLSLRFPTTNRRQLTGTARRDKPKWMTVLSPLVLSRLLAGTAAPIVTPRVSHTHTEKKAVLWNQLKQQGVGLSLGNGRERTGQEGWASHSEIYTVRKKLPRSLY